MIWRHLFRDNSPRGLRREADRLRDIARVLARDARALCRQADRLDAEAEEAERKGNPDLAQGP